MITIDSEARSRVRMSFDLDYMAERYRTANSIMTFTSPSLWTIEKHLFYLLKHSVEIIMRPQYVKKPWLLAYDQYGYVNLEFLIMYINNIFSAEEFDLQTVILPTMEAIIRVCGDNFPHYEEANTLEKIKW